MNTDVIIDLKSLFKYIEKNKKIIYKKIFQIYGIPTSKINNLPKVENELLMLSTGINMRVEEKLTNLIKQYEDDDSKIFNEVRDDFEFNSKIGFFEVLSKKTGGSVHVVDLKSSIFETLIIENDMDLEKGDLIFGFSFFDKKLGDNILYSNYILLSEEESKLIDGIYDEYFVEDDTDVFFDNIVLPRLMRNQLKQIDELLSKHTLSLMENFDQVSIYNFFKHFSDTIKYALFSNEQVDIYNMDYFDFLEKETLSGNFIVEGDLEIFIEILEFVMVNEVKMEPSKADVLDSIYNSKNKILVLKNNLTLKYPTTPIELVNMITDRDFLEATEVGRILTMAYYMDEISNLENPKITKKTRRLTAKTIRELISENDLSIMNTSEASEEMIKELIQLAVAIMLSNGLASIKNENEIYLTSRFGYFIMAPSDEVVANFLTAIFREETLKQYIGRKDVDYKELLNETIDFIKTLDDTILNKTPSGKKILNILEIIGLVSTKEINEKDYYHLTQTGEVYSDYLKSLSQKGRVLHLNKFK